MISNRTVQDITYSFDFYPSKMLIKGKLNPLVWTGKRLSGIAGCSYQYNSDGIRTKKITPNETTTFDLEGSNIISMNKVTSTENVRLDFVYDASSALIGVNTIEGHYFYIRDITGNIIGLIDNEGNYIVKYRYDAWGKVLEKKIYESCIASRHNPFVYKGYFLDEETGFYYLKSRYYDPTIRRFINPAQVEKLNLYALNGLNLYLLLSNNSVPFMQSCDSSTIDGLGGGYEYDDVSVGGTAGERFFNQSIVNGSFRNGAFYGRGSITALYAEGQIRTQWNITKGKFQVGAFGKFSLLNVNGEIGIGDNNFGIALKGVADVGVLTGFGGIIINPDKNDYFLGFEAKATVLTARGGVQLTLFGTPIEVGGQIDVVGAGFTFGVGIKDGEFYFKAGGGFLFVPSFYIRIKLW